VQASPSSHASVLGALLQPPVRGSQVSVVQGLLSLQLFARPGWQTPLPQPSPTVQALPSSQGAVLGVKVHAPVAEVQRSVVHGLSSVQVFGVPAQVPLLQVSLRVQASPSSQAAVLKAWKQPVVGVQLAVVQGLASSGQRTAFPTQTPLLQWSPEVHSELSEQALASLGVCTQPARPQVSSVQGLPSSQLMAAPG
jgi:uncharacterized membrane protein YfbV (UPF0208 family)